MLKDNIKKLRLENGLTQEKLGEMVGVSAMAVSQWENGRAVPRMGALERMASVFNVPVAEIVNVTTDIFDGLTPQEEELLQIFRYLDARARADLICIAKALSTKSDSIPKADVA